MIALDTNVLARFLVEDDPEQTERARAFLQRATGCTAVATFDGDLLNESGFLSP
jgi:hypothetical protein